MPLGEWVCGRLSPIASLLTLFLLVGCAGASGPERWKSLPEGQSATIFGTVTVDTADAHLSRINLYFRNVETREEAMITAHPWLDTTGNADLYERGKTIGWVYDMTLPPGRYEFFRYFGLRNMGQLGTTEYRSKQDFSVPFTVEAGKIHYLGEYRAYAFKARNVFGMSLPYGGYFVVIDNQARDTNLLEKQRKAPVEGQIINIVPTPDASSIFVRRAVIPVDQQPPP